MTNEIWKEIEGYDGLYEVSNLGRIRSLGRLCKQKSNSLQAKRARIMTQEITRKGYCRVRLYDSNGKATHKQVHRLVFEAFCEKLGDRQVNHKNEITSDNRIWNLEACDAKYNCNYGTRNQKLSEKMTGKHHTDATRKRLQEIQANPIEQVTLDGVVIATYISCGEASRKTGISSTNIERCVSGKYKTACGYVWRKIDGCRT